jgi:hypothetical protein
MRKIAIIFLLAFVAGLSVKSQSISPDSVVKKVVTLEKQVSAIRSENQKLRSSVDGLSKTNTALDNMIDSIKQQLANNISQITQTDLTLSSKIQETGAKSEQKLAVVSDSLSKKALYWIIAFLITTIVWILLYLLLNRRQKTDKSDFINQLSQTKSAIETNLITEFSKQAELMETQLKYLEKQERSTSLATSSEIDHSLAIKVADEINLIERNLNLMDGKTKGLKQLMASIGKLKDNLAANNYEMPELLGKPFHQGMKVIVTNSVPDSNLTKGEEKISKIIKPQINFNDKMIQTAQIEVSVGY